MANSLHPLPPHLRKPESPSFRNEESPDWLRIALVTMTIIGGTIWFMSRASAAEPDPVTCLADNIYYEAANEPLAGQLAVAQVTLNRVAAYDSDICSVVYFKRVNPETGKKVAAFSWTLGRAWRAPGPKNAETYRKCLWVALSLLDGTLKSALDPTVLSYHATYIHPDWHKRFAVQIGHHVFYRG